jgi:nicotinamidase-related amidase
LIDDPPGCAQKHRSVYNAYPILYNRRQRSASRRQRARTRRLAVFYTHGVVAADGSSAGLWRYKQRYHAEGRVQIEGSRGAAIIDEQPGDCVIRKWRPSAFFRTDFEVFLDVLAIDILLVCGTSVSDCVRAAVTDASCVTFAVWSYTNALPIVRERCWMQTCSTWTRNTPTSSHSRTPLSAHIPA